MFIEHDNPNYFPELVHLNKRWLTEHFSLEPGDLELFRDPGVILRNDGHTLTALDEGAVAGVTALLRRGPDHFELGRMAVAAAYRERGVGYALGLEALTKAKQRGATHVSLVSNTKLTAAIALYRKLGFLTVSEGQHPNYARGNITMRREL